MPSKESILSQTANEARGLAIDAITARKSGHLGLPLGTAEIGAVLFGETLNYNPADPKWLNRDRFILSAGHGSMFIYSWLHIAGYDVSHDDVKNFRVLNSKTPGHPEFGHTPGVECTTGPLGQGIGNAVGMALSAKMSAAHFNTPEHTIIDHHIVCLAGDGCLQEGLSNEASAFAGHNGLDNLIIIYDANDVTLDAPAEVSQSEDTKMRFESVGFDVYTIDGHDMDVFLKTYKKACADDNGKPKIIIAKTIVGKGIDQLAGTFKAHGEAGIAFADEARKSIGLPEEKFFVSEDTKTYFKEHTNKLKEKYDTWTSVFNNWKAANPDKAKLLQSGLDMDVPADLMSKIPPFNPEKAIATRAAGGTVLNAVASEMPLVITGSADLFGSTKNYINDVGDFSRDNPSGRNIRFGIREHAMGAIANGIAYSGIYRISGATFLTFSDYMRPSVRIAALASLPVAYIWTHDSIGVGEDGPTHQPVETVSGLRCIPNLDVIRPGDAEETAGAFYAAIERKDGPTALILSRQNLPLINSISTDDRRNGTLKGGYIAKKETSELSHIIIATGSELEIAIEAAKNIGDNVRVVSMPCMERFDRQSNEYKEEILPASCIKRVAIEAGTTGLWYKYVGIAGKVVGIDRFGLSAPSDEIYKQLGITIEDLVKIIKSY